MNKLLLVLLVVPALVIAQEEEKRGFHIVNTPTRLTKETDEVFLPTDDRNSFMEFLENIKSNSKSEIKAYRKSDEFDTHLKSKIKDISLSISFTLPKNISESNVIGYAPIGSYENGWSGIKVFFDQPEFGICAYSKERFLLINAESYYVKNVVNDKPSFTSIEGNYDHGFIYTVSWDIDNKENVDDHKIECFNKKLDKTILEKMISFSSSIDKK